jgi:hypothetical protein
MKDDQNIILSVDVNYPANGMVNYEDIHEILDIHNPNRSDDKEKMEFSNQTIGAISMQLRKSHSENNSKRNKTAT